MTSDPPRIQLRLGAVGSSLAVIALCTGMTLVAADRSGFGLAADALSGGPGTTSVPVALVAPGPVPRAPDPAGSELARSDAEAAAQAAEDLGALVAGSLGPLTQPPAGPPLSLATASAAGRAPGTGPGEGGVGAAAGSIPPIALEAYRNAAAVLARTRPGCHLDWPLLAGIGAVESDHGRFGGSVLGADGVARPPIYGPLLDGHLPGTAVIPDSDGGRLDGNARFDRALGPLQFLPQTFAGIGVAALAGAVPNPQNIRDASLSAGLYLCRAGGDVSKPAGRRAAVLAYNPSDSYVATVLSLAARYAGLALPPAAGASNGSSKGSPSGSSRSAGPTAQPVPGTTATPPGTTTTTTTATATATTATTTSTTANTSGSTTTTTPTTATTTPTTIPATTGTSGSTTTTSPGTTPSSTSATSTPLPAVTLQAGTAAGTLTVRWDRLGRIAARVRLERFGPTTGTTGSWVPLVPPAQVTVAPGAVTTHTWAVGAGRYRAVVQPLDATGTAAGRAEVSTAVTVTADGTVTPTSP